MKFENQVRRILINAAKIIASGKEELSCIAIRRAARKLLGDAYYCDPNDSNARIAALDHYQRLYSPYCFGNGARRDSYARRGRKPFGSATFWDAEGKTPVKKEQLKQERIGALLHAAASYGA